MLPRQSEESKRRLSQAEAARRLQVSKFHLNRVLRGHRQSRSLTRRYHALMSQQGRAA
jgi:hypothetical protein